MTNYPAEKQVTNEIDGINNWFWPEHDSELFIGPARDWIFSHREKYFKNLSGNAVCIQAGGACGMYPKLMSRFFDTVYTFEPHPESFYFLNKNCHEHNIVKFNAALGDTHNFIALSKDDNTNHGEFRVMQHERAYIPVMTIDQFNFKACDFIQLDVEGYEINAIRGGIKTIEKFKPIVVCEYSSHSDIVAIEITMHELGYASPDISVADRIFVHESKLA